MADPLYATVQDVKDRGVTDTDASILAALLRAEEWIYKITQQYFVPTELTIDQDGTGHEELICEQYPIQELTAVTFEYGSWGPTHTVNIAADLIVKGAEGIIVNRRQPWPDGENNVHLTGTFGEAECPQLIKEAVIQLAMAGGMSGSKLAGSTVEAIDMSITSETIGSYSYSRKNASNPLGDLSTGVDAVDAILTQFKRMPYLRPVGHRHDISRTEDSALRRIVGDD